MPDFDYQLFQYLNGWAGKHYGFDQVVIFFAEYFIWVVIAAVVLYFLYKRDYKTILSAFIAFVMGRLVLAQATHLIYYRIRPYIAHEVVKIIKQAAQASFPSGHTVAVVAIGAGIFPYHRRIGIAVIVCGVLIGTSRVIAGVHYPLDIVGGIVYGLAAGFITKIILKKLNHAFT